MLLRPTPTTDWPSPGLLDLRHPGPSGSKVYPLFYWLLLAVIGSVTTGHCSLRFQIKGGILGRVRAVFRDRRL